MTPAWLDTKEYPFQSHFFKVNDQKLHYIDEGEGETILFVHGTPSWSFDFRHVITFLSKSHRCVAIDHIGFGLSDKPSEYDYTIINHSKTLEKFILEKNLENITLVVHDFGGPIGLNFAIHHSEKIKRIVVLNSWLWSSQNDPEFQKFSKILRSPLLPFLYRYLNFSPRFILPKSFGDNKISKQLLKQYTRAFATKNERNGALAFARSLLYDQDWFEELWNKRQVLASKPVLFIWGMKDPVVKPHNLDKFLIGFPKANVVRLETCGHFPQEEQPQRVVEAIQAFPD